MKSSYVIGIDFGTLSARAVLIETRNGKETASAAAQYTHGVLEEHLPGSKTRLKPQSALQFPGDYLDAMERSVRAVLRKSKVSPSAVVGIGTDFTSCTVMPVKADGTPLCFDKKWGKNPHAWVKLWKHHAAQPEANQINETAWRRNEDFIRIYGGKYSSEWFFSKLLETLHDAPEVYCATDRYLEAGDWIVWQLCGELTRNISAAGFKGMRVCEGKDGFGYPTKEFFRELHSELEDVVQEKLGGPVLGLGTRAGGLTASMAKRLGLAPGIAIAAGNIDAHAGVPACGVTHAGALVMIMGTSTCHMLLGDSKQEVEGICGVVKDGVINGFWGYEAGQPGVGDLFAWFVDHAAPGGIGGEAKKLGLTAHDLLTREAAKLKPGESGLLALDWWNGNRSVLVDADLSGLLAGLTLQTRPHEIYRALIEATAFGTRQIIDAFTSKGVAIDEVYACGGLAQKNPLIMQIYADVIQRPIHVAAAEQASALGAAMYAAVAAGVHPDVQSAAKKMSRPVRKTYRPNADHETVYNTLFSEYSRLHDLFGRDANSTMKVLRRVKEENRRA